MSALRVVAVLVSEPSGLAQTRAIAGEGEARRWLDLHRLLTQEVTQGADAVSVLGDAIVVAFSSPTAAVTAATDLQRAALDSDLSLSRRLLRVAVATGEAYVDDAVFGPAVAAGVELIGRCNPGSVVVDDVTRQLCRSVPHLCFELLDAADEDELSYSVRALAHGVATEELLGRRAPFVGRAAEAARLGKLLAGARGGAGRFVVIAGEPGIGKTRMAGELARRAVEDGLLVLTGRAPEDAGAPYAVFADAIEDALHQLGRDGLAAAVADDIEVLAALAPNLSAVLGVDQPQLPPGRARHYLFASATRALSRLVESTGPAMLVLDDLHWADEATIQLVEHLAKAIHALPLLIVATSRLAPGEGDLVAAMVARLRRRRGVEHLVLTGLAAEHVADLAHGLIGEPPPSDLAAQLTSLSGGNPFLVEEALWHAAETGVLFSDDGHLQSRLPMAVSEGVVELVSERLRLLPGGTRELLVAMATVGEEAPVDLLAQVMGCGEGRVLEAIDLAESHRLVARIGGERRAVRFLHGLLRAAIVETTPTAKRHALHGRVAGVLTRRGGDATISDQLVLAHHLIESSDSAAARRARHVLIDAASAEVAAGAHESAAAHLDLASRLDPGDAWGQARFDQVLGSALRGLGRIDDALARWELALDKFEEMGEREAAVILAWELTNECAWLDRWDRAGAFLKRGLRQLGEEPVRGGLLLRTGGAAFVALEDPVAAKKVASEVLGQLDSVDDDRERALIYYNLGVVHDVLDEKAETIRLAEHAAGLLRTNGLPWHLGNTLALLARLYYVAADRVRWDSVVGELEPLLVRLDDRNQLGVVAVQRAGWDVRETGDVARYEEDLLSASAEHPGAAFLESAMAWTAFRRGRWTEALDRFDAMARREGPAAETLRVDGALVLAYLGDHAAVRQRLDPIVSTLTARLPVPPRAASMVIGSVEALILVGEDDAAARLQPQVESLVDAGWRGDQWVIEIAAGQLAATRDLAEAERWFERARVRAAALPARTAEGEALLFHGRALVTSPQSSNHDRERGRQLLGEASELFGRFGMPRHQAMCDELRRQARLGVRSPLFMGHDGGAVFVREGDYWLVAYGGVSRRLRHTKGLQYIAHLIRRSGEEVSSLELAGSGTSLWTDHTGADIDARGVRVYRDKIRELQDDISEAEAFGDTGRVTAAKAELETVTSVLAASLGLGGRARRSGSSAERARLSVTKAIKASIERIELENPPLGLHLRRTIRTGTFCGYMPADDETTSWRL